MSKLVNYLAPSLGGALTVVGLAYVIADQLVVDMPAPVRGTLAPAPANAETEAAPVSEPGPDSANVIAVAQLSGDPAVSKPDGFGLGRVALAEEVAAWDIDVRPDGLGLPVGSGNAYDGEEIFADNCAICHGDFGEGVDRWPVLAGGHDSLTDDRPVKTIGSYWPYLSTVWDYVHRAMPFGAAQSLSDDDVYAITAYLMYVNDLVEDDFELSNETFLDVPLPNEANFFLDDREGGELTAFAAEACMENCKDVVEITARAAVVDVTPEDAEAREAREAARSDESVDTPPEEVPVEVAASTDAAPAAETETAPEPVAAAGPDPELVAKGAKVFKKCSACHQVGEGAKNRTGPVLTGIVDHPAGAVDGFKYSKPMSAAGADGLVWSQDELAAFLTKPKSYMKGTKMSFAGLKKQADIDAVIAFLKAGGS